MTVVFANALDEQEAAGMFAVGSYLVGAVWRNGVALAHFEQDVFWRAEHLDLQEDL